MPWAYASCRCDGIGQDCPQCAFAREWASPVLVIVIAITIASALFLGLTVLELLARWIGFA